VRLDQKPGHGGESSVSTPRSQSPAEEGSVNSCGEEAISKCLPHTLPNPRANCVNGVVVGVSQPLFKGNQSPLFDPMATGREAVAGRKAPLPWPRPPSCSPFWGPFLRTAGFWQPLVADQPSINSIGK
jgi:hypothetical protein